jgi:cytoskeletal protein CcmA (bactofilin family)
MSDSKTPQGKHTLVEQGTELAGTIRSTVPIVVMGKIEGDISGPEIHVSADGVVAGKVKVQRLRSEGEIAGEVEAEAVQISGRVRDRTVIRARSLEVKLVSTGMEVQFGECELQVGDPPSKDAAIAAAKTEPPAEPHAEASGGGPVPVGVPIAAGTAPVDPVRTRDRKARPSEIGWDEAAAKPEAGDDEPKRKRGTQPPPVG